MVSSMIFRNQSVRLSSGDIPLVLPVDIISVFWDYPWSNDIVALEG